MGATNEGVYTLEPGEYSYTVTSTGFEDYTGNFSVIDKDEVIDVVLEEIV